jgi:hypothetical protein
MGPELGAPAGHQPKSEGGPRPRAQDEPEREGEDRDERIADHDAVSRIRIRQGEAVKASGSIRPAST